MRQGQGVCDFVTLRSDEEMRFAIVPLTEAEYMQALSAVASTVVPDNLVGAEIQDRRRAQEMIIRAIREESDLSVRVFHSVEELMEIFEVRDVDWVYDEYLRMTDKSSPSLEGISQEEFTNLKELLQKMDWNALSGRAWFAAKRFLSEITPQPLLDNSYGSSSTNTSITTKD